MSIDGGKENARVSAAEEGELSSEASTHPNADFYLRAAISDCLLIGFIRGTETLRKN